MARRESWEDGPVIDPIERLETNGKRVLILMLPFATPEFPGLGPTLIRSVLEREGLPADIFYGNLLFSRLVEGDPFVDRELAQLPWCEIAFTPYYFGTSPSAAAERLRHYALRLVADPGAHPRERFEQIVANAGHFLDLLFEAIPWERYDIVGFSVIMGQTVASLAVAKRIKSRYGGVRTIFGGPNTSWPMGAEMLRSFPEIDFILEGEADETVAPLVRAIRSSSGVPSRLGGLMYRDDEGRVRRAGDVAPVHDLDALPVPDFGPFFEQMERFGLRHVQPYLSIETSRGCWWGSKHHCTFCGIDDILMKFRSKSPAHILDEITTLSARHRYTEFFAVDSIINLSFCNELLPILGRLRAEHGWDFNFFFESKSNIRREQAQLFRYGGVNSVQPGLESFSDHILRLMDKGTSGARQIQCLKFLAEQEIFPNWNLIYRNPGETPQDIRGTIAVIPFLHHLLPLHPGGLIQMQVNRFAPYHNDPGRYGLGNVRAKPYYRDIYPDDRIDHEMLAFYFDYDYEDPNEEELKELYRELHRTVEVWRECYREDALLQARGPGFVRIVDRRVHPGPLGVPEDRGETITVLDGPWAEVFSSCDEVRSQDGLVRDFSGIIPEGEILAFLDRMVAQRLIYRSPSGQLINLPLLRESRERYQPVPEVARAASQPVAARAVVSPERAAVGGGSRWSGSIEQGSSMPRGEPSPADQSGAEGPDVAPLRILESDPGEALAELLGRARRTAMLRFDLGRISFSRRNPTRVLDELARLRRDEYYGLSFTARVPARLSPPQVIALRNAGVEAVTVQDGGPDDGDEESDHTDLSELKKIATVRLLHAAGIRVEWALGHGSRGDDGLTGSLAAMHHLPPPSGLRRDRHPSTSTPAPEVGRIEAVAQWWQGHRPWTLTYARGPGFVRIFDRRAGEHDWKFISLDEVQSRIFLFCEQVRSFPEIEATVPEVAAEGLLRFLANLVANSLMCRIGRGCYLTLPIRRKSEERWTSGDY
jgi:ribosomal peptide maturation radical SAM protein 1